MKRDRLVQASGNGLDVDTPARTLFDSHQFPTWTVIPLNFCLNFWKGLPRVYCKNFNTYWIPTLCRLPTASIQRKDLYLVHVSFSGSDLRGASELPRGNPIWNEAALRSLGPPRHLDYAKH